jgi:hypothetical protein
MHHRLTVGRTPWSARVPLDPLFAQQSHPPAMPERLAGGRRHTSASSHDAGGTPVLFSARRFLGHVGRRKRPPHIGAGG